MKKIYNAPQVEIVSLEENEMICTSIEIAGSTEGNVTSSDSRYDVDMFFDDED